MYAEPSFICKMEALLPTSSGLLMGVKMRQFLKVYLLFQDGSGAIINMRIYVSGLHALTYLFSACFPLNEYDIDLLQKVDENN